MWAQGRQASSPSQQPRPHSWTLSRVVRGVEGTQHPSVTEVAPCFPESVSPDCQQRKTAWCWQPSQGRRQFLKRYLPINNLLLGSILSLHINTPVNPETLFVKKERKSAYLLVCIRVRLLGPSLLGVAVPLWRGDPGPPCSLAQLACFSPTFSPAWHSPPSGLSCGQDCAEAFVSLQQLHKLLSKTADCFPHSPPHYQCLTLGSTPGRGRRERKKERE